MLLQLEGAEEEVGSTLDIPLLLLLVTLVVCVAAVSLAAQKQMPQATAGSGGRGPRYQVAQEDWVTTAFHRVLLVLSTKEAVAATIILAVVVVEDIMEEVVDQIM